MGPSHWFTDRNRLHHAHSNVGIDLFLDFILPVKRDGDRFVVDAGLGFLIDHEPHQGCFHEVEWLVRAGVEDG